MGDCEGRGEHKTNTNTTNTSHHLFFLLPHAHRELSVKGEIWRREQFMAKRAIMAKG